MKTKLIGLLAIVIAISVSAFTTPTRAHSKRNNTSYVWFKISGSISPNADVPKADATYINTGASPSSSEGCSGSTYQCVSGFNASQVSGEQLKDNNEAPVQQPYQHD